MNQETRVNQIQIKPKQLKNESSPVEVVELPERKSEWGIRFFQFDSLMRNFAIVGVLVLVLIAMKNTTSPEAQSVFSAIQETSGMKWDESLGKLSFVNTLLPDEIQEVWNETYAIDAMVPLNGMLIHAWSQQEPYLLLSSGENAVYAAADGEVMSVAHGVNEEKIVRIRHENYETVYGNMENCAVEAGDIVKQGEIIGKLFADHPLAFEMRYEGRNIDPAPYLNLKTK